MANILVTGAAGFIGFHLCGRLLAPGDSVTGLDNLNDYYDVQLKRDRLAQLEGRPGFTFARADLADRAQMEQTFRDQSFDIVVNLAAQAGVRYSLTNPHAYVDSNLVGFLNVLEGCRHQSVKHLVYASSSSVYGSNPTLPKNEDDWTRPLSPYAVSKLATEGYAIAYQASYGMRTLPFRFFNVYGPGQAAGHAYAAVIPKFIDAALNGQPLEIHGDGKQSRDFTFVADVCAVIMSAVERKLANPGPVNLAFNTNTTLLELIAELEAQLGQHVAKEFTDPRVGDVRASQADAVLLRELFPDVTPRPLTEGLAATLEWYRGRIGQTGASS